MVNSPLKIQNLGIAGNNEKKKYCENNKKSMSLSDFIYHRYKLNYCFANFRMSIKSRKKKKTKKT